MMLLAELLIILFVLAVLPLTAMVIYSIGSKKRESQLEELEEKYKHVVITDLKVVTSLKSAARGELISANLVMANNYFISFCASYRKLFGGEIKGYSRLASYGRRRTIVRLKEKAVELGATEICALRFEMTTIGMNGNPNTPQSMEFLAYGTAVIP